jgi:hypothetical protein
MQLIADPHPNIPFEDSDDQSGETYSKTPGDFIDKGIAGKSFLGPSI